MMADPPLAETLALSRGASRCALLPHLGGSIAAWSVRDQEMLRTANSAGIAAGDPYATAGFPLVPFSNRVNAARFEWHGDRLELAANFPPEPHAIHGVGFQRPWQVQTRSDNSVVLELRHRPDSGWPWAFDARQRITLADDSLTVDLSATNREAIAVPLAVGHHPYLPRAGARLTFYADGVWLSGDDGLPAERVALSGKFDFSKGAPVERADIDHCYSGWGRAAYVNWPDKPHALEISASPELTYAVVYSSAALQEFCFEPVAHMNDALNRREPGLAMPVVAPGESFSASMRFRAVRPARQS
jgi:aldose 1-epimerase